MIRDNRGQTVRRLGSALRHLAASAVLAAAISGFTSLAMPAAGYAQGQFVTIGGGNVAKLTVAPGNTLTITTDKAFSDLVVGNSKVADVVPLTERSMYIQGNGHGTTNISIYDSAKNLLGVIDVRVQLDLSDMQNQIRRAVPSARIQIDNVNDRIRISGKVQSSTDLSRVLDIAQQYSEQPVLNQMRVADAQQVMLQVRILEASRQSGRDLGIGFKGLNVNTPAAGYLNLSSNPGRNTGDAQIGNGTGSGQNGAPFGQLVAQVLQASGWRIDIIINALEQKGLARRLAEPNLVALSGTTASFDAGGEVPITTAVIGDNGASAQQTDYRPYGVRLEFTPTVLDDGLINLEIKPEVSEIDRSVNVNGQPGFISRTAHATLQLRDGQSFAMAGLLNTVNNSDVQQMPWLGQVPVLGALFRSTSFQKRESDLVIVVTPHLVRPASPGEKLYSPLDKTRPGNDVDMFLLGMLEVDKDMIREFKDGEGIIGPYGHIIDLEFGGAYAVGKK